MIEGNPSSFAKLQENRPNVIALGEAVCPEGVGSVTFAAAGTVFSGDMSAYSEGFKARWSQHIGSDTIEVPCRPISAMFRQHGVTQIDFWSLDVEGAELKVLETMDFEAVHVKVMIVEQDRDAPPEFSQAIAVELTNGNMCEISPSNIPRSTLWVNRASKFVDRCTD